MDIQILSNADSDIDNDEDDDIFEEVRHWLRFIEIWEEENSELVPENVLSALENALEQAVSLYRFEKESDKHINIQEYH